MLGGWKKVIGSMVFGVKMEFVRKAHWILDGHRNPEPEGSLYAGVVSRDILRIALMYVAFIGLNMVAADIRNAFIHAPSSQKDYIICRPEFGLENVGKKALIRRALYGGKATGRNLRNHLRECIHHLFFVSCPANGLFQLQMSILFPFLITTNIHRFLLLIRTRSRSYGE